MAKNYLDQTGLALVWAKIKELVSTKVDKVEDKGLSSNDYTSDEKTKLAGIASGAQVNVLEGIQKNGNTVTITNKIANISVPTKTSDITNDSGYITSSSVPTATTTTPKMDGTASVGTETKWAKGDHVHPSDTTKVDKVEGKGLSTNDYTTAEKNKLSGIEEGAEKNNIDWIMINGMSPRPREDRIYNITIPENTSDLTNDSGFITAADVPEGAAATTTTPKMDGTATVGTETAFARGDHVHPSDTTRVPTSRKVNGKALSSDITLSASDVSAIPTSEKGAANGVCPLNSSMTIDSVYLPSFVDDVIEAYPRASQTELSITWLAETPESQRPIEPDAEIVPQSGVIYVLMADSTNYSANSQFRWGGSSYVKLNDGGVSPITNEEINTICV